MLISLCSNPPHVCQATSLVVHVASALRYRCKSSRCQAGLIVLYGFIWQRVRLWWLPYLSLACGVQLCKGHFGNVRRPVNQQLPSHIAPEGARGNITGALVARELVPKCPGSAASFATSSGVDVHVQDICPDITHATVKCNARAYNDAVLYSVATVKRCIYVAAILPCHWRTAAALRCDDKYERELL